jgi:hypothetical protein
MVVAATRNAGVLFAGLVVACGPSVKDSPEFAELCGQQGPVQILALADDEVVIGQSSRQVEFEGRWLYPIRQFDRPVLNAVAATWGAAYRDFSQVAERLESLDPCGGDRRVIAEGLDEIRVPADPEGPWLGTGQEGTELSTFDPTGSAAPRHLASIAPFRFIAQGRDVYVQRAAERDFARVTVSADDLKWRVLVDDVLRTSLPFPRFPEAPPHRSAVVLRSDGALVGVDLRTDDVVPLASGVGWFWASWDADGRWVAYGPGPADELPTEGWLLDRETGQLRSLDSDDGSAFDVQLWWDVLSVTRVAQDGQSSTEFTWLPDGPTLTRDANMLFVANGDDRQLWLLDRADRQVYLYALVDGEPREVAGPFPEWVSFDGGLWYHDRSPYSPSEEEPGPYDVVHVPSDTLQPRVVERRVWSEVSLPGDRWARIAPGSVDDTLLGRLQIVDGATGDTTTLDEGVSIDYRWLRPGADGESWPQPWETEDFVYGVRDPEGGRTGLWRVALSADE